MARPYNPTASSRPRKNILLGCILFILGILIGIGDIVRYSIRSIFLLPVITYKIILRFVRLPAFQKTNRLYPPHDSTVPGTGNIRTAVHEIIHFIKFIFFLPDRLLSAVALRIDRLIILIKHVWRTRSIRSKMLHEKKEHKERELLKLFPKGFSFPRLALPHVRRPHLVIPPVTVPTVLFRKKPGRKPKISIIEQTKSFIAGVTATIIFFYIPISAYQWLKALPNPTLLSRRDLEVTTKIFDRNGVLLYEIYADQNRTPLTLSEIPKYVKDATLAIEDRDFYRHQGVSPRGIVRALREIILNKQIQGGSTITQQLIKSALLTPEITITRKIKEILLAFWAERIYTKDQILEMYLNQVPYGGTAWGIEAASQTYFGKSIKNVNLAEAALLAGLPAAPSVYSPFGDNPDKAYERQREVLTGMADTGVITQDEKNEALSTPITFAKPVVGIRAPHFVMFVKNLLEERYGPRLVQRGGLRITTTLDIRIQDKVQNIVTSSVESLRNLRVGNGAAMVTDPATGELLAMVGSKDYFDIPQQGNVNVTTALRQPGSSIKVVTYAAALEDGYTAATVLDDSAISYQSPGGPPYSPVNYDGKFHGPTPLRYALANSYNIPAVKVLNKIGVITMIEKGKLMGITTWTDPNRYGLSLTLGGGEVTMYDMMKVFGTLANGGKRTDIMTVLDVSDYTGHVYEHNKPAAPVDAVKPGVAWIMGNILSDNTARTAAFGPNSSLVIPGKTVSVKTGTTDSKRDNWTFGYTPSYVVGVWVGNNDNTPMDPLLTSGVTGAAPIWHDIMSELLKNKQDEIVPRPYDVTAVPCYYNRPEYFIAGTQPAGSSCAPLPTPTPSPTPTP